MQDQNAHIHNNMRDLAHMLDLLRALFQVLARTATETSVCHDICRVLVDQGSYCLAWIGCADDDYPTVYPPHLPGDELMYTEMHNFRFKSALEHHPVDVAFRSGQPTIVRDIFNNPAYWMWRSLAQRHGFASFVVLPLIDNEPFGAVAVYAADPHAFSTEHVQLLAQVTDALAAHLILLRTQRSEQKDRSAFDQADLLQHVSDAVIATDLNFIIQTWNNAAEKLYGWRADEAIGHQISEIVKMTYLNDEGADVAQHFFATHRWQGEVIQYHKDGTAIDVFAAVSMIYDSTGTPVGAVAVNRDITERKRIEAALRDSEIKFRTLAETVVAGISIFDNDTWIYVNPAMENITGYTREELLAMDIWSLTPDATRDRIHQRALARQRGEPVPSHYEFTIRTKQGGERWLELTACLMHLGGKVVTLTTVFDITERKNAEAELKQLNATLEHRVAERSAAAERHAQHLAQSEAALRDQTRILQSILYSMADAVVVVDVTGQFVLFNPAAERIYGIGPVDMDPTEWAKQYGLYLPDMKTRYPVDQHPLMRAIRGEASDRVEMFVRRDPTAPGSWISVKARPLRDEHGTLCGGVAVVRDITERKRIEASRAALMRHNEALVEAMGDVVYEHIISQDTVHWGGNYTGMFGYTATAIGSDSNSWLGKIHLGDLPHILEQFDQALAEHRMYDLEYRFQHQDGSYLWVKDRGVLHSNDEGDIQRIIGVIHNITERKQAEEELQQRTVELESANGELEAFSYSVSHDLRAPLRAIEGFSHALREDYADVLDDSGRITWTMCAQQPSVWGNLLTICSVCRV